MAITFKRLRARSTPDLSRNRTSGFCADFTELVYTSILSSVPALINSETPLALVVFNMREELVDADSVNGKI
jgi:hypothetical protein